MRSASFGKSWVIKQALVVVRDRSLQGFARRLLRSHPLPPHPPDRLQRARVRWESVPEVPDLMRGRIKQFLEHDKPNMVFSEVRATHVALST